MNKITSVIVALFLVLAVPVTAQFYRYIDKDGNLRFTDDLNRFGGQACNYAICAKQKQCFIRQSDKSVWGSGARLAAAMQRAFYDAVKCGKRKKRIPP